MNRYWRKNLNTKLFQLSIGNYTGKSFISFKSSQMARNLYIGIWGVEFVLTAPTLYFLKLYYLHD